MFYPTNLLLINAFETYFESHIISGFSISLMGDIYSIIIIII